MPCSLSAYVSSCGCTQALLRACYEDLGGHGATLQARAVVTLRWRRGICNRRNWKEKVKRQRVRLGWCRTCGTCGLQLPAEFSALRGMSLKVVRHCFLIRSSPLAGSRGSLFRLSFPRRIFRMDCKGSRWHLNSIQVIEMMLKSTWKLPTKHKISLFNYNNFYEKRAETRTKKKAFASANRIRHAIRSEASAPEHGGYLNMQ